MLLLHFLLGGRGGGGLPKMAYLEYPCQASGTKKGWDVNLLVEIYERVANSVILVCRRDEKD